MIYELLLGVCLKVKNDRYNMVTTAIIPLATECNILKELIKPPNILRTIANSVTGKSK